MRNLSNYQSDEEALFSTRGLKRFLIIKVSKELSNQQRDKKNSLNVRGIMKLSN